jgi:SAM-dependent methyltransferase
MDKYELARLCKKSSTIEKIPFIQDICRDMEVLDLGCLRHNAEFAEKDPNWLHQKIKDVAKRVVGFDYLEEEVKKLKNSEYDIRYGDVTKPLPLSNKFDVIIAGDLIEHLSNFEGFFENCSKFLKNGGILLLSTCNPFYTDGFHYAAIKGAFVINPEHTCWIDPQSLSQLAFRFGFNIAEIHYIEQSWHLADLICERKGFDYDILNDRWKNDSFTSKATRKCVGGLFRLIYTPYKILTLNNTKLVRYADYIAVLRKDGYGIGGANGRD